MVHERRSYVATAASGQQESLDPRAKHAIRGAWFGFFVDMFDIYLPIVVLAPALIYFVPPDLDTTTKAVISGTIFAATLLGRPVGSFIFGHFADSIGRDRKSTRLNSSQRQYLVCRLLLEKKKNEGSSACPASR